MTSERPEVISYRKTCRASGTGLSHYVLLTRAQRDGSVEIKSLEAQRKLVDGAGKPGAAQNQPAREESQQLTTTSS